MTNINELRRKYINNSEREDICGVIIDCERKLEKLKDFVNAECAQKYMLELFEGYFSDFAFELSRVSSGEFE